jgi:hypothetical protein
MFRKIPVINGDISKEEIGCLTRSINWSIPGITNICVEYYTLDSAKILSSKRLHLRNRGTEKEYGKVFLLEQYVCEDGLDTLALAADVLSTINGLGIKFDLMNILGKVEREYAETYVNLFLHNISEVLSDIGISVYTDTNEVYIRREGRSFKSFLLSCHMKECILNEKTCRDAVIKNAMSLLSETCDSCREQLSECLMNIKFLEEYKDDCSSLK